MNIGIKSYHSRILVCFPRYIHYSCSTKIHMHTLFSICACHLCFFRHEEPVLSSAHALLFFDL